MWTVEPAHSSHFDQAEDTPENMSSTRIPALLSNIEDTLLAPREIEHYQQLDQRGAGKNEFVVSKADPTLEERGGLW